MPTTPTNSDPGSPHDAPTHPQTSAPAPNPDTNPDTNPDSVSDHDAGAHKHSAADRAALGDRLFVVGAVAFVAILACCFLLRRVPSVLRTPLIEAFVASRVPSIVVLPALVAAVAIATGAVMQIGDAALRNAIRFVRSLGPAGLLALGAIALPPLGSIALFATFGVTAPWLRGHAEVGILIYVVAFAVLAGLALLPTYAQSALGGFAFGITLGVPAALAGFVGGALIGYTVARRVSGDRVEKALADKPKWRAVRDAIVGRSVGGGRQAFLRTLGMVILLRLPPNSPFAFMNLLLASSNVPRGPFLLGTAIGMLPRTALAVVIGKGVNDVLSREALERAAPPWVWAVSVGVTIALVAIIGVIANRALDRVTRNHAASMTPPSPK